MVLLFASLKSFSFSPSLLHCPSFCCVSCEEKARAACAQKGFLLLTSPSGSMHQQIPGLCCIKPYVTLLLLETAAVRKCNYKQGEKDTEQAVESTKILDPSCSMCIPGNISAISFLDPPLGAVLMSSQGLQKTKWKNFHMTASLQWVSIICERVSMKSLCLRCLLRVLSPGLWESQINQPFCKPHIMQTNLPRLLSIFEQSPLDGAVAWAAGESKNLRSQNCVKTVLFSEMFSLMVEKTK